MHFRSTPLLCLGISTVAAGTVGAQELSIALRENDFVFNVAAEIERVDKLAITDAGLLFTECQLSLPSTRDTTLLLNGFYSLGEGVPLAQPAGTEINSFLDLDVNESGFLGWPLDFDGGDTTNSSDTGIFWNTLLMAREGDAVAATDYRGEPLPLASIYSRFNVAKINNRNSILFSGQYNATGASNLSVLSLLRTDGAGTLVEEQVLYLEGLDFPGTTDAVTTVNTSTDSIALANDDSFMAQLKIGSNAAADSVIVIDDEILAREGSVTPLPPDPISGEPRVYTDLGGSKVDLNDFGDYVFTGFANGDTNSNAFLVVNGEVYLQEGENLPAFGNETLDRFDSAGVDIANSGDVYWYARTDGSSSNIYLLRNRETILNVDESVVSGDAITGLLTLQYAYYVSDSGRFWIAEARGGNGDDIVVLADFGTSYPLHGCGSNPGSLSKVSGEARVGEDLTLTMDGEQAADAVPMLFFSLGSGRPGNLRDTQQCGLQRPFGEIMISLAASDLVAREVAPIGDGSPVTWDLTIPNDSSLVGMQIYSQGVYFDAAGTSGTPFQLTNGFYIEVGAP